MASAFLAAAATSQSLDDLPTLLDAGRLSDAARVLRTEAENATDDPLWAADAWTDACLLSTQAGDLEQAATDCAEAVSRHATEGEKEGLARALNNRALLFQRRGELVAAEADYRSALDLNESSDLAEGATINRLNLAVVVAAQGRYDEALRLTRAAEQTARRAQSGWSPQQELVARINQGALLEQLEAHRAALDLYLSTLQGIENGAISSGTETLAHLELNAGVALRNLGDPMAAVERYETARSRFEETGNASGLATVELNLGIVRFLDLGQPERGLATVARACSLAEAAADLVEEARCAHYRIDFLTRAGELDEARRVVAALRKRDFAPGGAMSWLLDLGGARIARVEGDLDRATDLARQTLEKIFAVAAGAGDSALGAGFVEAQKDAFGFAIDLALHRAEQGEVGARRSAFELALEARERQFTQTLLGRASTSIGDSLDIGAAVTRLLDGALPGPLVDLHRVGSGLVRFTVDRGQLRHRRFDDARSYVRAADRTRQALARGDLPRPSDLDRLATLLDEVPLAGPIHLSAPGALAMLPWDVVPLGHRGSGDGQLVADRVDVALLPNAALAAQQERTVSRAMTWVAVAQSDFTSGEKQSLNVSAASPFADFGTLPDLPDAESEVHRIRRALGDRGRLLTGSDASRDAVIEALEAGVQVAHFATHTAIDERPGGGAALLLHDDVLDTEALAGVDLDVQLAVLAACSTRQSPDGSGRLLGSLTGAWLVAGVEAVVATLWDVDDATTAAFMEQFYFELGRGRSPQRALAETKRRLRRDAAWRHPSLWSAYVLVGTTGPIVPTRRNWVPPAAGVAALGLLLAAWRRRNTQVHNEAN